MVFKNYLTIIMNFFFSVNPCIYKSPEDMPYLKKMDIENHNRDGGLWVVYNNKVYDIQDRFVFFEPV